MTEPGPRWLDAGEQRAWRAFLAAARTIEERVDAQLQRDSGMPHAYYEILVRLSEAPGGTLRMSQLASVSGSSRSRLSHAAARLEERGWVRRTGCPTDRRGQVAELTGAGRRALESAAPGHVEEVRRALLDPLSPAQVAELRRIMNAIAAAGAGEAPGCSPASARGRCGGTDRGGDRLGHSLPGGYGAGRAP